ILGNSRIVESIDEGIIDQYVRPACLMLQLLDGRNQTSIMTKKGQASGGGATLTAPAVALLLRPSRPIIDIAGHQCVTNKDLSRLFGVDAAVMHPPTGVDSKAVECRTLVRHHLPGPFFPTRVRPALTEQVCTGALHPARSHSGNAARAQPGALHEFRRHDPAPCFLAQRRARVNVKAYVPGSLPEPAFVRPGAHVAQQAG